MKANEIELVHRTKNKFSVGRLKTFKRKGVKAFLLCSTGIDHFPVKEALDMGFIVKNVYYGSENAVAPHGFRMLDNLNILISKKHGLLEYPKQEAIIIGSSGNVGRRMAQICKGYGMQVYGHDIKNKFSSKEKLLEKLFAVKFIFLCCNLNNSTKDYFSDEEFKQMENFPIIINVVGRLDLIPLKKISKYLSSGTICGYACDELTNSKLKNNPNCLFTKHIGWKTNNCVIRRTIAEAKEFNKLLHLEGKP